MTYGYNLKLSCIDSRYDELLPETLLTRCIVRQSSAVLFTGSLNEN